MEKEKLVHLDLKGAPPKPTYLAKFFLFVKSLGVTGILLEWEDTFPYTGEIIQVGSLSSSSASGGHYNQQEASEILESAKQCGLTVIPLVQTFGHLEFVLKHEEFKQLSEESPCCLCPSQENSLKLVKLLIDQIVAFHPDAEYIHIGADEVLHLGFCEKYCLHKVPSPKYGLCSIWLEHVSAVAKYIKLTYPNLKIIIWDDMLRNVDESILQEYNIGDLVEPMVWYYQSSDDFFKPELWNKYCNVFPNIWAASAFKGATGCRQIMPITAQHIENQECWIRGLSPYSEKMKNFRGIAVTGWSRYDHYATLCELLPCGIPSLFWSLITLQCGRFSSETNELVANQLKYKFPQFPTNYTEFFGESSLNFPGCELYISMGTLDLFLKKYKMEIEGDRRNTWVNDWQLKKGYVNMDQLLYMINAAELFKLEIAMLEEQFDKNAADILYEHTIEEIKGTLIIPIKENVAKLLEKCRPAFSCRFPVKPQ